MEGGKRVESRVVISVSASIDSLERGQPVNATSKVESLLQNHVHRICIRPLMTDHDVVQRIVKPNKPYARIIVRGMT